MFGFRRKPARVSSSEESPALPAPPEPVEAPVSPGVVEIQRAWQAEPQPLTSPNPFDTPMSPRQSEILDLGWEVMKHQGVAHVFLWLAEDGWQGGHEILAWRHGPGVVAVKIKPWETLYLVSPTTLN